ncbi:MAG: RidA family protein [Candidatus Tectomicrobia bacterium]|nr:RidA family protein [Candidatus Tectomicrobia bacterium]
MSRKVVTPTTIGAPVTPYSHGILTEGKEILFLAGQVPIDKAGKTIGIGDIEAQARCVYDNLEAVLKEAGMGWSNVTKFNIFMTRRQDRDKFSALREKLFKKYYPDGKYPISTLVFAGLYREDFLIEIEAVAVR